MAYKRALISGIGIYISSFILATPFYFLFDFDAYAPGLAEYATGWLLLVPIVLFWAKYFFKEVYPSAKSGLVLGVAALLVGFVFDLIVVGGGSFVGNNPEMLTQYVAYYSDWRFWATLVEVLVLSVWAGVEFDATFTASFKK